MFHFPAFPPHRLYIHRQVTRLIILVPGFPIRTSSDQSSVDSSPRHFAASHVLHRLPVPRHPPCALKHLQTQKPKRLKLQKQTKQTLCLLDARNHYPRIKHHTPPPSVRGQTHTTNLRVASGPNSVPGSHHPPTPKSRQTAVHCPLQKHSAPPTTHYRRRQTYPNHRIPHGAGTGEKGAP